MREFAFLDPEDLTDRVVRLRLAETRLGDPEKGCAPCYFFDICDAQTGVLVGGIRLRIGDTEDLRLYAGQIGYGIGSEYRGRRFAARAVGLVARLAVRHGLSSSRWQSAP